MKREKRFSVSRLGSGSNHNTICCAEVAKRAAAFRKENLGLFADTINIWMRRWEGFTSGG
jgi:hypothetical protein